MSSFYVSLAGSDSNPGTLAEPFLTIAHGLGVLAPGDTLFIRAGTYDEVIWESMLVSGTPSLPIRIQNYLAEVVILQPTAECIALRFETTAREHIQIAGLVLDQSEATCTTEPVALIDAAQSDLLLERIEIKNGASVGLRAGGSDNIFQEVTIHDCDGNGFESSGLADSLISQLHCFDNGGDGAFIDGAGNVVERASCHANGGDGISIEDSIKLINSLSYLNVGAGIRVANGTAAKVLNCTSAKNTGSGIEIEATATDAEIINTILRSNTAGNFDDSGAGTVTATNIDAADPLFVNEAGNDFRLQQTSPAVDSGSDLSAEGIVNDYAGTPRPLNGLYDIGAYEFFTESAEDPGAGIGTATGSAIVQGLGEFLSTEGTGTATGAATVQGLGEFVSSEGTGTASGSATVQGLGAFIANQPIENPKTFLLRVAEARIGPDGRYEIDAVREDRSIYEAVAANPFLGAGVHGGVPIPLPPEDGSADNSRPGSTRFIFLDIPLIEESNKPGLYGAASGANEGWAGAALFEKSGSDFIKIGDFPDRAVVGTAQTALASGPLTLFDATGRTFVFDDVNTVDVKLMDSASELVSVSDADMLAGRNVFVIGARGRWELISAGIATLLSPKVYRLSHLLRGLKGTEWAAALPHRIGDTVVLLNEAIRRVTDQQSDIGVERTFRAVSYGRDVETANNLRFTNTGISQKPLSPVFIRGEEDGEGNRIIRWWGRSRLDGLAGRDGTAEPPPDEVADRYEVDFLNSAGTTVLRTVPVLGELVLYTAAQQGADHGSLPATLKGNIYKISPTMGRGYAGHFELSTFDEGTIPLPVVEEKPYRLKLTVGKPKAGQYLIIDPVTDVVLYRAGLASCRGEAKTAATVDAVFSIRKCSSGLVSEVEFGTMTIQAGQKVAVFDSDADVVFDKEAGDVFAFVAPTPQDATLENLGVTLHAERI